MTSEINPMRRTIEENYLFMSSERRNPARVNSRTNSDQCSVSGDLLKGQEHPASMLQQIRTQSAKPNKPAQTLTYGYANTV